MYEVIGNIAVLPQNLKNAGKLAKELVKRKNIETVLLKVEKVKGRLRKAKFRVLAGKRNFETIHKENNCPMKLDLREVYFSSRLSNDRKEIAEKCKKKDKVLVMFAGAGPYALVIAKNVGCEVVAVELNKKAVSYMKENVKLNKLDNIEVIRGDVKRIIPKLKEKFDVIVMPRPQLKETFLKEAFLVAKKGAKIFYHDFDADDKKVKERILQEAKKLKRKIKILKVKKAGELSPRRYRWRIDLRVYS